MAAQRGRLPELKRVIAAYGERIAMEETLESSLQKDLREWAGFADRGGDQGAARGPATV